MLLDLITDKFEPNQRTMADGPMSQLKILCALDKVLSEAAPLTVVAGIEWYFCIAYRPDS
jgi:hypothetical protein